MTTDHAVRPAVAADLPLILRAERQYVQEIEPTEVDRWTSRIDRNLELWIRNLDRTTVLLVDDEAAGYVMWTPDGPDAALLVTIQVLAPHRRRGHGLRLLEVFADQARRHGAGVLRLGAHEANPARPLYAAAGYRTTGRDGDYVLYERPA